MYEPRTYRDWIKDRDLVSFNVIVKETDLHIRARSNLETQALESIKRHRQPLEDYIKGHPDFYHSLEPVEAEEGAPPIVTDMAEAAETAGVGPMAAVAGAVAEAVGRDLLSFSPEIIVENGGDIFMKTARKRKVGIFAGAKSPFSGKIALEIDPEDCPLGICTSSGTVGPSLSFGYADAVIILAGSAALADAAATAVGNNIKTAADIDREIGQAGSRYGISGLVIIKDDRIGLWGNVRIAPVK
jgi:uncharacterized protein